MNSDQPFTSFQTVYICHLIYSQCQIDIMIIDWEIPKDQYSSVSIWRRIMAANEFNRLQSSRKTSIEITLFIVTAFNIYVGEHGNIVAITAINALCWLTSITIQFLWRTFIYERYITEPKSQCFIDLCTLANISWVFLDEQYHGYLLYCRSPYDFADCSMEQMLTNMDHEVHGFVASRGLVETMGSLKDCQTFQLFASDAFRIMCDQVSYSSIVITFLSFLHNDF